MGQTKDHQIGIYCFSAKYVALRRKSSNWLARNKDNVSECSEMSIRGLVFNQCFSTIKIPSQRVGLVQNGPHHHFIEN